MSISRLIGNQRNKDVLRRLIRRDDLGATMIFAGPSGIGKKRFAVNFAKAANCLQRPAGDDDACDSCPVCQRIDAGTFSDVFIVEPDGAYIKIAQTRGMIGEVLTRPIEGKQRFFILDEADKLRGEAATSLLKTLEEPPPTSTVILVTSRPDALLPTIRSRSLRLNFSRLADAEMDQFLRQKGTVHDADVALLAHLSGGRPGVAEKFDLAAYRQDRQELISLVSLLVSPRGRHRLVKAAEYYGKREREDFEKQLDLLRSLVRDMILLESQIETEEIVNSDTADQLSKLGSLAGINRLSRWAASIEDLQRNLRFNVNRTLATEATLLAMAAGS